MKNQKVALITGANRGLGLETARQLGEQNITVVLTARKLVQAEEAARKFKLLGIDAYPIQLDVTKSDERKKTASFIDGMFGRLDILINNAGVVPKEFLTRPLNVETPSEEFDYVFEANFFSVVHLTGELLPLLKRSEAGRIVNVSSIVGSLTMQSMENSPFTAFRSLAYNASKTSLNMFTILLAEELKNTNIRVNSAHPGWVKTDMGTQDAPMEIKDGAKTAVQLALIGQDGPSGKFIHSGESLPW
jgi:NAD(P)-dependent dehydrogenase (short-subunit alcohol dehydrogenase family)